jgi:hypothetical protein
MWIKTQQLLFLSGVGADMIISRKITNEHVPGKYCKERQHCSTCTSIRHYLKILRHVSGACLKNKNTNKCQVCSYLRQTKDSVSAYDRYVNMVPKIIKNIYTLMLKGKYI